MKKAITHPTEALTEILDCLRILHNDPDGARYDGDEDDAEKVACELEALAHWLRSGGLIPNPRRAARRARLTD